MLQNHLMRELYIKRILSNLLKGVVRMKFFIDTANLEEVREANALGILDGVTTTPTLVEKEGVSLQGRLKEITREVSGPVSAELISEDAEGMVEEGKELAVIAPTMTVNVPMTMEGLKAVKALSELNIKTNVTLISHAGQALLAARAGASYVSPFLGIMEDAGCNGLEVVSSIAEIFDRHGIDTEIIAASIRHPLHVKEAAYHGAHISTVPFKVLTDVVESPFSNGEW